MEIAGWAYQRNLPIDESICFSDHKMKQRKKIKLRQLEILFDFEPLLKRFLEPDEKILLASRACSPMSALEQLTTGWVISYIKRCVLIFTDRRILHFPSRGNYKPRQSIAQIRYTDIDNFKLGQFLGRVIKLTYKSGKKENFNYIPSGQFKKIKTLLPRIADSRGTTQAGERHHLCPRCTSRLESGRSSCPACRLEFKDAAQALRLSLLFPGGGYFYTRHNILGFQDAIIETILIIMFVLMLAGLPEEPEVLPAVIVFGGILFFEKVVTIYHARHYISEFIPVDKDFTPVRRP